MVEIPLHVTLGGIQKLIYRAEMLSEDNSKGDFCKDKSIFRISTDRVTFKAEPVKLLGLVGQNSDDTKSNRFTICHTLGSLLF